MIKALFLSTGAAAVVVFSILQTGQLAMFLDLFSPLFVLLGGVFMAFSVSEHRESLLIERLEAFRTGCILFGAVHTLIGIVATMASMGNPKMIGPALALALLTLLWAACLNYIAKLVIISKSGGG
tara:strand:- start:178 stop:552 length:375 start_codon:yes stop_codon:yes gene_type:complete